MAPEAHSVHRLENSVLPNVDVRMDVAPDKLASRTKHILLLLLFTKGMGFYPGCERKRRKLWQDFAKILGGEGVDYLT